MFCNKKCDKCNHLMELVVEKNGQHDTVRRCVFHVMLDSLLRIEAGQVRLQAATESARNQKNKDDLNIKDTIAKGFLALTHSVNENPKAVEHIQDMATVIDYKPEEDTDE